MKNILFYQLVSSLFILCLKNHVLLCITQHKYKILLRLIIDKKERKLKKGSGFHLDIVLICILNVGCGFMGAPFVCAATVRSVTHVSAVTVMSRTHAPGDKPHIIEVKGNFLTKFWTNYHILLCIHIYSIKFCTIHKFILTFVFGKQLYFSVAY